MAQSYISQDNLELVVPPELHESYESSHRRTANTQFRTGMKGKFSESVHFLCYFWLYIKYNPGKLHVEWVTFVSLKKV